MSEEWGELSPERIGRATASRIKDIVATIKSGGYGASRERYRTQLVREQLWLRGNKSWSLDNTGYESPAMRWGKENEPLARAAYELETGNDVSFAGFVVHPRIPMAGASPDGLVAQHGGGGLEIKCPESHTHHATLKSGKVDSAYIPQVQWQMACTERTWVDWVSYDPRWPEENRLFIRRVERDNKYIATLEDEVRLFLAEVEAEVKWFERRQCPVR